MTTHFDTYIINAVRYVKYDDHKLLEKIASDGHASSTKMLRDELKRWKKYYDAKAAELTAMEKKYKELQVAQGEEDKDVLSVTKFEFEGKEYLRDDEGTVYDLETHEEVGTWCETTKKIYIFESDDESDDESDEEAEVVPLSKVD